MQARCIDLATSNDISYEQWEYARNELVADYSIVKQLPEWLIKCRYGGQFWSFIKQKSPTYQGRREFIWGEFSPLLDFVEQNGIEPTTLSIRELLAICNSDSIRQAWQKCFERRVDDPEGAITSARTLIESTCQHIVEQLGGEPDQSGDLPRLYKQTAKLLNLAPDQHDEQVFKQILSGCGTIVDGLSSMRNKLGDAHGKSSTKSRPSRRHAEFAVNLAGSLSSFLIATFEERSKNN